MDIQSLKMRQTLGEDLLIHSLKVLISIWLIVPILAYAVPSGASSVETSKCNDANSQFGDIKSLLHDIALVTKENRKIRDQQNTNEFSDLDLESVQGRFWCPGKGQKLAPNIIPTKKQLIRYYAVGNATVVFDGGTVLTSRHAFINDDGTPRFQPSQCFFEHIKSGQLFRATDRGTKYLSYVPGEHPRENDYAIIRLEHAIQGVTPIKEKDILVNSPRDNRTALTVVSNYAQNAPGANHEALTITSCLQMNKTGTQNGTLSKIIQTDCNTGQGSSAAQVYVDEGGSPKLFGIVAGDIIKPGVHEGSGYKLNSLSTGIVRFDSSLLDLYHSLPPIQQEAVQSGESQ